MARKHIPSNNEIITRNLRVHGECVIYEENSFMDSFFYWELHVLQRQFSVLGLPGIYSDYPA